MIDMLVTAVPSFNSRAQPISDSATLMQPANLCGLPSDSTLVLVNGKRRQRNPVVAVNAILMMLSETVYSLT